MKGKDRVPRFHQRAYTTSKTQQEQTLLSKDFQSLKIGDLGKNDAADKIIKYTAK